MSVATDGAMILSAILAEPDEDVHRWVMADWLEENGQSERAEFIRLQLRLDERALTRPDGTSQSWRETKSHVVVRQWLPRERELFSIAADAAMQASEPLWGGHQPRPISGYSPLTLHFGEPISDPPAFLFTFRRGFVEEVRCTLAAWNSHGRAIVQAHPVTRVEASDKEPLDTGITRPNFGWWGQGKSNESNTLPRHVWLLLTPGCIVGGWTTYPSRELAQDALSRALLIIAKQ